MHSSKWPQWLGHGWQTSEASSFFKFHQEGAGAQVLGLCSAAFPGTLAVSSIRSGAVRTWTCTYMVCWPFSLQLNYNTGPCKKSFGIHAREGSSKRPQKKYSTKDLKLVKKFFLHPNILTFQCHVLQTFWSVLTYECIGKYIWRHKCWERGTGRVWAGMTEGLVTFPSCLSFPCTFLIFTILYMLLLKYTLKPQWRAKFILLRTIKSL